MHCHKLCKCYYAGGHFGLPKIGNTFDARLPTTARLVVETFLADVILPTAVYIFIDPYVAYVDGQELCHLRGKETAAQAYLFDLLKIEIELIKYGGAAGCGSISAELTTENPLLLMWTFLSDK